MLCIYNPFWKELFSFPPHKLLCTLKDPISFTQMLTFEAVPGLFLPSLRFLCLYAYKGRPGLLGFKFQPFLLTP